DEIFGLFRETRRLTDGTYLSKLRWALADGDRAVAVYRARGRRLGRQLDIDQVLLIELRDGRRQDGVALPADPQAFEGFRACCASGCSCRRSSGSCAGPSSPRSLGPPRTEGSTRSGSATTSCTARPSAGRGTAGRCSRASLRSRAASSSARSSP